MYNVQGKNDEAENTFKESLAISKKVFGDEHPYVAESLTTLASLYNVQGKYDEAENTYKESLAIRKKVFGDEHPDVAEILDYLAGLYNVQGKYELAASLCADHPKAEAFQEKLDVFHEKMKSLNMHEQHNS